MVLAGHVCMAAGDEALARSVTSGKSSVGLAVVPPEARGAVRAFVLDWREGEPILAWTDDGVGLFPAEAFAAAGRQDCTDDSVTLDGGELALDKPLHWIAAARSPLLARARSCSPPR